jgi:hypothetical protein
MTRGATVSDTGDTLSKVTLQRAAELTGRSRSTIHRAMEKGRLSFEKDETGNRAIDVSELDRVFGLRPRRDAELDGAEELHRHDVQLIELRAQLEIERSKRALLEERIDELREERDRWRNQTERMLTDQRPRPHRSFWQRLTGTR